MNEAHEPLRRLASGGRPYGIERGTTYVRTRQALDDGLRMWAETLGALCQSLVRTLHERSSRPDISIFDVHMKPRFWKDTETETARRLVGHGWVLQAYPGYLTKGGSGRGSAVNSVDTDSPPQWMPPTGWCLLENASIVEYTGDAPTGERRNGEGRRIDFLADRVHFPPSSVAPNGGNHVSYNDHQADLLRSLGVPEPYTREHLDAVAPVHREIASALASWNNLLGEYARSIENPR